MSHSTVGSVLLVVVASLLAGRLHYLRIEMEALAVVPQKSERSVLVVTEWNEDYHRLRTLLSQSNWASDWAATCAEAVARLASRGFPIVICEQELPDGSWRDVTQEALAVSDPPIVIVASAQGNPFLFGEVRSLGGIRPHQAV